MSALVYCPFPDFETAREVGQKLLDEKLIGCINIGGAITSLFDWAGERGEGKECAALLKTHASLLDKAMARLEVLHPYEAPAILGWPCIAGKATAGWLAGLDGDQPDGNEQ